MPSSQIEVTQLLLDWGNGDKAALDKLVPVVYQELRRLAGYYMRRERPGHTLQTSALVNEAYMRLVDYKQCIGRAEHTSLRLPRRRCAAY